MKHYFILNPFAGQGKALKLEKKIWQAADAADVEPVIHITEYQGEAEEYVRRIASECASESTDNEVLRFYACGGDGTLSEVVNGAYGAENVQVANIPVGTGNDFIRNFDGAGDFNDILMQIRSGAVKCDLIHYEGNCEEDGIMKKVSRYCINMFNIGFDCNVVDLTDSLKKKPLMAGPLAYLTGVGIMLVKKKGADLTVEYDDGFVYSGSLLMIAVANGCYCGGGVKGIPDAETDDGLIDVSLVKDISRRTFVKLFPKYSKGTHRSDKRIDDILIYKKCRSLTITSNCGDMKLCVDGEIVQAEKIYFDIVPKAIGFVVPGTENNI